jgi:hypothetical protein
MGTNLPHPVIRWLLAALSLLKHKVFFWLLVNNKLNTRKLIRWKNFTLDTYNCELCIVYKMELVDHFFRCCFMRCCWEQICVSFSRHVPYSSHNIDKGQFGSAICSGHQYPYDIGLFGGIGRTGSFKDSTHQFIIDVPISKSSSICCYIE